MRVHAVRHAFFEPGMQNTSVPFDNPPSARDWIVDVPISSYDSWRNNSPNPSMVFSSNGASASGVLSRPVKPVPPVVSTTSTTGSAIQRDTIARL